MRSPTLLAVPNVSEGRVPEVIAALAGAFTGEDLCSSAAPEDGRPVVSPARAHVRVLDIHSDRDHHRSVFTLAGRPGELSEALLRGAAVALEHLDVVARGGSGPEPPGQHPHIGAVDVVPIVYLSSADRGAACAEALVVADRLGHELELPVFLYGELTATEPGAAGRTRAELRRGGVAGLSARMSAGEALGAGASRAGLPEDTIPLVPDFGPPSMHPSGGATMVAARPPLVAFNLQLAEPASLADARAVAARVREGGEHGLPGLRAIGVALAGGVAQVSMNVEQPFEVPLAVVVEAVARHARVRSAELVGLAPAAALERFPEDLPIVGFDPARHIIENALGS
jgi:glutamate formiminotransferase